MLLLICCSVARVDRHVAVRVAVQVVVQFVSVVCVAVVSRDVAV